jgi:hypothetical protein
MRALFLVLLFTLFIVGTDLYAFRGIHHLIGTAPRGNMALALVFWGITGAMLAALVWAGTRFQHMRDPSRFFGTALVIGIFLMLYVPKLVFNIFQLLGDISHLATRLLDGSSTPVRKWFLIPGAVTGILLLIGFGMGMLRGRTNVKLFSQEIGIDGLDHPFEGLRIVQISDLHLAGFYNHPGHVKKVVDRVNDLEPDLILFTGDMVHNFSEEMEPFMLILDQLQAPLGKYAVLG